MYLRGVAAVVVVVVVGKVVIIVNNFFVAVAATVGMSFIIDADGIVDAVVITVDVVVITSGTATCVPKTVFALRKLCKRILSEIKRLYTAMELSCE